MLGLVTHHHCPSYKFGVTSRWPAYLPRWPVPIVHVACPICPGGLSHLPRWPVPPVHVACPICSYGLSHLFMPVSSVPVACPVLSLWVSIQCSSFFPWYRSHTHHYHGLISSKRLQLKFLTTCTRNLLKHHNGLLLPAPPATHLYVLMPSLRSRLSSSTAVLWNDQQPEPGP